MPNASQSFISRYRNIIAVIGLALVFLALRLPAIHAPYHQDEYKWPEIVNAPPTAGESIPHPPLGELIYKIDNHFLGPNNFRTVPLIFGFFNLILVFILVRRRFGFWPAFLATLFFVLSFYSVLASLMVDTDGQILPFFLLLSFLFFDLANDTPSGRQRILWIGLMIVSIILGILIKVSFILPVGALFCAFIYLHRKTYNYRTIAKWFGILILGLIVLAGVIVLSARIFPFFNLHASFQYWAHFFVLSGRNYFQTFIETAKAILYVSPALLLSVFLMNAEEREKLAPFWMFLILGLLFYLVIFDFSTGALDRYYEFAIVPLSVICGVVSYRLFSETFSVGEEKTRNRFLWNWALGGSIVAALLFLLQFRPQAVPPLSPKSAWLPRLFSLHWNFLFPFTGGSGPLGFYVSFGFIGVTWVICVVLFIIGLTMAARGKKTWLAALWLVILVLTLGYNIAFTEEYLFGGINGSAPLLVAHATSFIAADPAINEVVVYNDNGGYNIQETGKYERRLYADPMFLSTYKQVFSTFKGYYLVINIPRIDPNSLYMHYLDGCTSIYHDASGYISAVVYDCRSAPVPKS